MNCVVHLFGAAAAGRRGRISPNVPGTQIKIVRSHVAGGLFVHNCFLARRKFGPQLVGDGLSDLALNREHISQFVIVCFRPHVGVIARVDELRIYPHAICRPLHAAL